MKHVLCIIKAQSLAARKLRLPQLTVLLEGASYELFMNALVRLNYARDFVQVFIVDRAEVFGVETV